MSDIAESGSMTTEALESATALSRNLTEQLGKFLPKVIDAEGEVDWKEVSLVPLARQTGKLVMAHAVPELQFEYAELIAEKERQGQIDDAIRLMEQSERASKAAIPILQAAEAALYQDVEIGDRITRQGGQLAVSGDVVREYSDALLVRMQSEPALNATITTVSTAEAEADYINKFANTFINNMVQPSIQLVRRGYQPAASIAIVDLATAIDQRPEDVAVAAEKYFFDLNDELDRDRLREVCTYAGGLGKIGRFISPTGEIDERVLEGTKDSSAITEKVEDDDDEFAAEYAISPQSLQADEEPDEEFGADWDLEEGPEDEPEEVEDRDEDELDELDDEELANISAERKEEQDS